jgi:NitT/TauT family transport system substrate-binding protein
MTDARWKSFAASMIKAGVYPPTIDLSKAYTLRFVNKKVGMELKSPRAARSRP